jgi:hypothetical protein
VAVADLTGHNLNVYYEVGIRHALRQPIVLIADEAENGHLPFDLLQQRTIFYSNDMAGSGACRKSVTAQLERAVAGHVDSPVEAAANLRALGEGTAVERTLADLVTKIEELTSDISRSRTTDPPQINPLAMHDLLDLYGELQSHARRLSDEDLLAVVDQLARPLNYLRRRIRVTGDSYRPSRAELSDRDPVMLDLARRRAARREAAELADAEVLDEDADEAELTT